MKRELAFVLKEREKLTESMGRTRSRSVCKTAVNAEGGRHVENGKRLTYCSSVKLLEKSEAPVVADGSSVAASGSNGKEKLNGSAGAGSSGKRNGVSVIIGLAARRFTRSSLNPVETKGRDSVLEDKKTCDLSGHDDLDRGEGESQNEQKKQKLVLKEEDKLENGDSFNNNDARVVVYVKRRKGYSSLGGFVKRFTRSSIKVMENSEEEQGSAHHNAINVLEPDEINDIVETPCASVGAGAGTALQFYSSKKYKESYPSHGRTRLSFASSTSQAPNRKSKEGRKLEKISKKMLSSSSHLKARKNIVSMPSQKKTIYQITRKDIRVHRVVFQVDGLPDGTELGYFVRGKKLLTGYKNEDGIVCGCCDTKITASNFEAHAGCARRRKPYHHIFTSNGVSLHEFAVDLLKGRRTSTKESDDCCIICSDGGKLLCCDMCPRAFHLGCLKLSRIPSGKWFCNYCTTMFERDKSVTCNANAIAAGRTSGVNPIEQIKERCIRIMSTVEVDFTACALCRDCDCTKSGFDSRTIIICDQCELEFHVGCLKQHKMADLKKLPKGKWFCGKDCNTIYVTLQKLVNRGEVTLPDTLLTPAKKKQEGKESDSSSDLNLKWRLLKGEIASSETGPLLSKSVKIFRDCFDPIKDKNGKDLIPFMVYGKNTKSFEYGGIYCAVLTVNSVVISAAIFRVYGHDLAELPLVATSSEYQGQGYFQVLFSCIEQLLASLKIKKIVLPSAVEAKSIWTDKFGFTEIEQKEFKKIRKRHWQVMSFDRTTMLEKNVPKSNESLESLLHLH